MSEDLLTVRGLTVEFATGSGVTEAVRGIDYSLSGGETLAILGESGSGKTVAAMAVAGLLESPPARVTSGSVTLSGQELLTMPAAKRRRDVLGRRIGMVFQDALAALNPAYPVGLQIVEGYRLHHKVGRAAARRRAVELMDMVRIPAAAARVDDYPHEFSGGMRQRIVIAMACALEPEILIADEPTTALDVTVQAEILDLLQEIQADSRMGMILISHDLGVVARVADRVAVMHRGLIVESGPIDRVYASPQHDYTKALLAAIPRMDVGVRNAVTTEPPQAEPAASQPASTTVPVVEARDIVKHYRLRSRLGGKRVVEALRGVSLVLRRGEILGLVGESGSGKSTLGRLLLRLEEPSAGQVFLEGTDLATLGTRRLRDFRRHIQMVFQDPYASLNPRMRVDRLISEAWDVHPDSEPADRAARIKELLEAVGLSTSDRLKYAHQFSGGQRQRIAIARALAPRPAVLVCDEPVSALDVLIQAQVVKLLRDLQADMDFSCVFISHDLAVVRQIVDRLAVLYHGELVEEGDAETVFDRPRHPYTQRLLAAALVPDPQVERDRTARAAGLSAVPGSSQWKGVAHFAL